MAVRNSSVWAPALLEIVPSKRAWREESHAVPANARSPATVPSRSSSAVISSGIRRGIWILSRRGPSGSPGRTSTRSRNPPVAPVSSAPLRRDLRRARQRPEELHLAQGDRATAALVQVLLPLQRRHDREAVLPLVLPERRHRRGRRRQHPQLQNDGP